MGARRAAAKKRAPSKTRIVSYKYDGAFDEPAVDRLLDRARRDGVITECDCGSRSDLGTIVWFEGPPGPRMRMLREQIFALAPPDRRKVLP